MALTHEQEVRLDNFKAHYNIVMGNIKSVNDELSSVLNQITSQKKELVKVSSDYNDILVKLNEAKKGLGDATKESERKVANALKKEIQADNILKAAEEKVASLEGKYKKLKANYDSKESSLRYSLSEVASMYEAMADKVGLEIDKLNKVNKDTVSAQKELNALEKKISDSTGAIELLGIEYAKKDRELSKELDKVQKDIDEKLPELERRDNLLEAREIAVKDREDDAAVLVRRIQQIYKKHYPNITLEL